MVAGKEGMGKSTFIDTLLEETIVPKTPLVPPEQAHLERQVTIEQYNIEKEFFGNRVSLTFLDVINFGHSMSAEASFSILLDFIESRYREYLEEETRIKRNPKFEDNRVDVLLYFIEPTGKGLTRFDRQAIKALAKRVNVIPVLAKGDSYSPDELVLMKQLVMEDIRREGIQIYDFTIESEDEDDEEAQFEEEDSGSENEKLRKMLPFCVIGADPEFFPKRGRSYPWGFADADNEQFSNLIALKNVLFGTHLQDIKEKTQNVLYENFRTEILSAKN